MQTIEAKNNLQICAGKGGRTAVYCKECLCHAYSKDGYFPEINHKKDCMTGQALTTPADPLLVSVSG
jgi:hypothetical protein